MNWYNIEKISYINKEADWNWIHFYKGLTYPILVALLSTGAYLGMSKNDVKKHLDSGTKPQILLKQMEEKVKEITIHEELPPPVMKTDPPPSVTNTETPPVKKVEKNKQENTGIKPNIYLSRVIYSEASENADKNERYLVASVIKNRVNHPGFEMGKLNSPNDVISQDVAFEAIGHSENVNWRQSERPDKLKGKSLEAWNHALELSKMNFNPYIDPNSKLPIVYYHDKSIKKPRSWDNKYWRANKAVETKNFIFYTVVPKNAR